HAERFERLGEPDVLPLDLETLGLKRLLDIDDGHGTIELFLLAHLNAELERDAGETVANPLGCLALLLFLGDPSALAVPEDALGVPHGRNRLSVREQEIAGIPVGDADRRAPLAKPVDVFEQNDFHEIPPTTRDGFRRGPRPSRPGPARR